MKKTLITGAVAVVLGLLSAPSFASGYVVNGHAASPAEAQLLVSYGAQPGNWTVNGWGVSPAVEKANVRATESTNGKNCRYVLDVLLCD